MIYTLIDACEDVLKERGESQSSYWLCSIMNEMKLWKASEHEIRAVLDNDIAGSGERSRFVKMSDSEYALRSWISTRKGGRDSQ